MDCTLVEADIGRYSYPTTVMPDELVGEIFRRLDFAGRVSASHVCASWRRIALSDRRLWSEYIVRNDPKADVLSALLARSDPLPFCLACDVPDAISELVIAHMVRMEDLCLDKFESDDALQRILDEEIPVLNRFAAIHDLHGDTTSQISTRWASAPRLEHLGLACTCVWPANGVFTTLLSYTGDVPEGPGLNLPLSQIFPNLKVLSLYRVRQVSLARLAPLPPSLATLELRTGDLNVAIDSTALLRDSTVPLLRELLIERTHDASCVFAAIRLFERLVDGPWKLSVYAGIIGLRAPLNEPHSYQYSIICSHRSFRNRIAGIVPFCGKLGDLELELADLVTLCAFNANLPALGSISIILTGQEDSGMANALQNAPGIQTPVLQSLRLKPGFQFDQPIGGFLDRIVHAVRSPRLATIFVDTDNPSHAFDNNEIAAFLAHAARVEIRTRAGEAVYYVFGHEDSQDATAVRETGPGMGSG